MLNINKYILTYSVGVTIVCGVGFYVNNLLCERIIELRQELKQCETNIENFNNTVDKANKLNAIQERVSVKYNQMKKKEYKDETDSDLSALHDLDVLLEQKSIIGDTKDTGSKSSAN